MTTDSTDASPVVLAWGMMSKGYSLDQTAKAMGIDAGKLDRALWRWRAFRTDSLARTA